MTTDTGDSQEPQDIHQAHDKLFKVTFSSPANTAAFLRAELPAKVSTLIDWSSLALESASFIDSHFARSESDLLFSASLPTGRPAYLHLLFEHQTNFDPMLALRILRYMVRIFENASSANGPTAPLPVVLAFALAQNAGVWKLEPHLSSLFDLEGELECLRPFVPDFTFGLYQLAATPYEEIRGTPESVLVLRTMKAERIGELLSDPVWDSAMLPQVGRDILQMLLRYMLASDVDKPGFERRIQEIGNAQTKQDAMTLAQQYREEGLQKGLEKGLEKGLQKGRMEGILASRRQDVLEALEIRFDRVPPGLRESIEATIDEEKLRTLHRAAILCGSLEEFSATI